jgi:hypothetical protein
MDKDIKQFLIRGGVGALIVAGLFVGVLANMDRGEVYQFDNEGMGMGGVPESSELNLSTSDVGAEISAIKKNDYDCIIKGTKCPRLKKYEKDGSTYETHEYKTPDGETGYQVIIRKTVKDKEYVKSIGYGVEADDRTSDWAEVISDEDY